MTLLVKILLITSLYLPNNDSTSTYLNRYNPNFLHIDIFTNTAEESLTENLVPIFNQETKQENNSDLKFYKPYTAKNTFVDFIHSNSLNKLLPYLIDQPPPAFYC